MDFSAIPRPAFGRHAQHAEDKVPAVHTVKAAARRAMMFKEAKELLSQLPTPGDAVHGVMTGTYDLMLLLVALLDLHAAPCRRLRIATLCYNRRNAVEMLGLLETKKIGGLTLLASDFFRGHNKDLDEWFRGEMAAYPGSRIAAARSHCKVVCFDFADGAGLVLEGSANLRTNGNREQMVLANDRALHDWHAAWIDDQVNRYGEGDERGSNGTG
jgi:hypothetical protein